MNKRLLMVCLVILLIFSIGVISAADSGGDAKSISVKVNWNGDANSIPNQVTVDLLRDGTVVDTAVLNKDNSWETTFSVDEDGKYEVNESDSSDYSFSISGDADKGFVITNTLLSKNNVIGSTDNKDNSLKDDSSALAAGGDDSSGEGCSTSVNEDSNKQVENNSTDDNKTDDDNQTDNKNKYGSDDNETVQNSTVTTVVTKTVTKEVVKQNSTGHPKHDKVDHKTGLPVAILVLAVIAVVVVIVVRRKE